MAKSNLSKLALVLLLFSATFSLNACGKEESTPETESAGKSAQSVTPQSQVSADESANQPVVMPPRSDSYFVLDRSSNYIYGIDLAETKVTSKMHRAEPVVQIQFDPGRSWTYEAIGGKTPGLDVYDTQTGKYVEKLRFQGAPSAILYHPIQDKLYLVSEEASNFRVFDPDSIKFTLTIPMTIQDQNPVKPKSLSPGPLGKLITSNSAFPAVTQVLTEHHFMQQTVVLHEATRINDAVFSFDGNSSFSCDTEQGALFRVEFGTGKVLAELRKLNRPRFVQFEVLSNTIVVVVGRTELVMLNPDTFRETGRVNLSEYGEEIVSLLIPPKSNYAELLLEYKGVKRWMRFEISSWEPTRLVELL